MSVVSCFRSGEIVITTAAALPPGVIELARGPARRCAAAVEGEARLARDGATWLVPGIPEAISDDEALVAARTFADRLIIMLNKHEGHSMTVQATEAQTLQTQLLQMRNRLNDAGFKALAVVVNNDDSIGVGVSRIEPRLVRLSHAPRVGAGHDEFVVVECEQVGFGMAAIADALEIPTRFASLYAAAAHLAWLDGRIASRDLIEQPEVAHA